MNRHDFLRAQEWLTQVTEPAPSAQRQPPPATAATAPTAGARQQQATDSLTAFAGAASIHLCPQQHAEPATHAGPFAADALHCSFSVDQRFRDPMQLRLSVQLWPGDEVRLDLDGTSYRLNLCSAVRLVLPQQLAALLPSTMLQLHDSFFAVAPLSPVPYLTLVSPHACFNMFPLGWKAAAAHLSKEHDASELLRLAHVLAVSRSGQLQQQQNSRATASAPPDVPSADWQSEHSAMLAALQRMSAAAELLRQAGSCTAACPDPAVQQAWQELAVSASTLCDQRSAAAAALPAEKLSLQSKQSCLASLLKAVVGRPGCDAHAACDQAKQALAGLLGQQRQAAACSMLAAPV